MGKTRSILLFPFALVYGAITAFRNFLYDTSILPSHEFSIPVICIGNITVGGTGKTPHTEYLVSLLTEHFKVAVLSRGYKRKTADFRLATADSTVADIGDEPLQISRKFPGTTVAVDRNRVNGVKKILHLRPETQVILLDDAFQHRRIKPGFSILLTEYNRLIINDHMLPWGDLRESASNMKRANIILVTKTPPSLSAIERRIIVKEIDKEAGQNLYFTSVDYLTPVRVFELPDRQGPNIISRDSAILLVTGIANPAPMIDFLKSGYNVVETLVFPDHWNYREKDIEKIISTFNAINAESKYIITTEKDAVRIREFANIAESLRTAFWYIPIGISFLNDDQDEFDNLITDYVRKNK